MAEKSETKLLATRKVKSPPPLVVKTAAKRYGSYYYKSVDFELETLRVRPTSWIWLLLRDWAEKSESEPVEEDVVRSMRKAIVQLADNTKANLILAKVPAHVDAADIRQLFQIGEEISEIIHTSTLARGHIAFRAFVYAQADTVSFAEKIDAQRVRFKPTRPFSHGKPRALISDLHDISDLNSNVPVGALAAQTAKELTETVKARTQYDLQRIRNACIAEMTAAATLRTRATELRRQHISSEKLSLVRKKMLVTRDTIRKLERKGLTPNIVLIGALRVINERELEKNSVGGESYGIPFSKEVRRIFQEGIAEFTSLRYLEVEHRAYVEELFAAFHLLHTYTGWNWSSVMSLQADGIDLGTPGTVLLQSYKSKTDDDTPVVTIDLTEPGVQMAVELLLWNRKKMVESGEIDPTDQTLWITRNVRTSGQRSGYFHPVQRLRDFTQKYVLPRYSFEQVRTQFLFNLSLQKGGIEVARLKGGHSEYGATQRYVGNVVQDRISSALNLEFSKRLEKEIRYLYQGGKRNSLEISLLRPIGDGASCVNPAAPPPGRSKVSDGCPAEACHIDGGCPNRRIIIDDGRVEEVLRLNRHYTENWQRLMQENPERFAVHVIPHLIFNSALLLALKRGPYAARVMQVGTRVGAL